MYNRYYSILDSWYGWPVHVPSKSAIRAVLDETDERPVEKTTVKSSGLPKIKKAIFNKPVTVVIWEDGTKSVVRMQPGDKYDREKGLAMAIAKKALGNTSAYYDVLKEQLKK